MSTHVASQQNGAGSNPGTNHSSSHTRSQWLFTPDELLKAPSVVEGLAVPQELANRQKGVNFITQVGIMLKLPQLTLSTAAVFLHRYYMRFPMQVPSGKGTHHYQIAATALFLATKVEENCRKMKELIVACCRVAQKNPNAAVDDQSKEYWKWRDTILHHEDMLLEALCFDLQLEQPHRVLFDCLCYYGIQDQKVLRNTSWAFVNDSHVTTICLLFSPKIIAGSALYAGIKLAGVTLPDDDQGRPWWQHLDLDIFEIQRACNQLAEVYENPALPRQGLKDAYLREEDIMSFEKTRRTQSPSNEPSPAYSMGSASQGVKREREESWGHEPKNGHSMEHNASSQSANDQAVPSPKKQRTGHEGSRMQRVPSGNDTRSSQQIADESKDGIQQRIDDIVRSSSASQGPTSRRPPGVNGSSSIPGDQVASTEGRLNGVKDQQNDHDTSGLRKDTADSTDVPTNGQSHPASTANDASATNEEVDYGSEEGEV